jgi:hypothetical protein
MIDHRKKAESDRESGLRSDYWSGDFHHELMHSKNLFRDETDMAFIASSDGVKVFKSRRSFTIWPILLICMNLPPNERFKRRNLLVVGFVPGPTEPHNLNSFLYPLIQEFLTLDKGVKAWNGYRGIDFTLKAYICLVTGDMLGRAKLQCFKGNRGTR